MPTSGSTTSGEKTATAAAASAADTRGRWCCQTDSSHFVFLQLSQVVGQAPSPYTVVSNKKYLAVLGTGDRGVSRLSFNPNVVVVPVARFSHSVLDAQSVASLKRVVDLSSVGEADLQQ